MELAEEEQSNSSGPPIYVVSGGAGGVGELVARVAIAQFQGANVPVIIIPQVRQLDQLDQIIYQAATNKGLILHTMVDRTMRFALIRRARARNVVEIDLMGGVLARLTTVLGREPIGQPGLYVTRRSANFERLEAIEYTVDHDDGRRPDELKHAEMVLLGVSRVGKTPLSMYLAVLGWKVANIPLVKNIELPKELFEVDRRRVIGLTIDPEHIVARRRWRQRRMGIPLGETYTELEALSDEISESRRIFRRHGFAIVDLTDKPIEESADEVISLVTRWFKHASDEEDTLV
ncbi:MAG: kinase/pyrophosphorylase [Chloroflexales bacterium]|nr:kinase/pyrophosphorylase [Chloroflexales bacterium]